MNKNSKFTRRQFLQVVAAGGTAGLALKLGLGIHAPVEKIVETRFLMGTVVNITIITDDARYARSAAQTCLDRMQFLENVFSRFITDSPLSRLNREGFLHDAPAELTGLMRQSLHLGKITEGAFDITVKPLLDLYMENPGSLPNPSKVEETMDFVGYRKIGMDNTTIKFPKVGMSITMDGIAKGYIVDEGVSVLRQFGLTDILLEAGGDLLGLGDTASQVPWKIGLQAPRDTLGKIMTTFSIQNQAVATSGDYMQYYTSDFIQNHIIDPRLGHSPGELASVTVITTNLALADGLATAVMVLGKKGIDLIETLPDCEAYLITKELDILKSSGL